jgi:hypothetical protein
VEYRAGRVVPRYIDVLIYPFIRVVFEQYEVKIFQVFISSITLDNFDPKIPDTYGKPRHGLSRRCQVSVLLAD